jgi:hypothetical protein
MTQDLSQPHTISSQRDKICYYYHKRVTFEILVGTSMGGLVVAEVGLIMMVVVVIEVEVMIEIVAWSAMDQDASRCMWLTLLVSRVQVSVIC